MLFGYLGKIQDLNLYPSGPPLDEVDESTPAKECYIMFEELETVGVSLHLNQTSFIDRALVVAPMHEEIMPDEQTAKSIGTPIQVGSWKCQLFTSFGRGVALLVSRLSHLSR